MAQIRHLLCDMDGVLINAGEAVPGAIAAIQKLDEAKFPYLILTNNTRLSKREVVTNLGDLGFRIPDNRIITALEAAGELIAVRGLAPHYLVASGPLNDLPPGAEPDTADCVVVGDLMRDFSYDVLDEAFRVLHRGGALIAIHKNRYWRKDGIYHLDCGPFVAALEYGASVEAEVVGKPSQSFFDAALHHLGKNAVRENTAMVGDDVISDIKGARTLGITGALVRTGKYKEGDESLGPADTVLNSIADVPDWLGI